MVAQFSEPSSEQRPMLVLLVRQGGRVLPEGSVNPRRECGLGSAISFPSLGKVDTYSATYNRNPTIQV